MNLKMEVWRELIQGEGIKEIVDEVKIVLGVDRGAMDCPQGEEVFHLHQMTIRSSKIERIVRIMMVNLVNRTNLKYLQMHLRFQHCLILKRFFVKKVTQ
jgi:hypothetical protein